MGIRDRAILGTLTNTGARVGAVALLRIRDLRDYGDYRSLRFREKRGKEREIPLRLDLNQWLQAYLLLVDAEGEGSEAPLFRPLSATSRSRFSSRAIGTWTIRPCSSAASVTPHCRSSSPRTASVPWSSPTCFNRASPSRMSSTSSATPTRRRPRSYFDPPPADPERIPTREELTARFERDRVEDCILRGGDPQAEGLGPHGSLIGGPGKPLTVHHIIPENHARLSPLPLTWFDCPRCHTRIFPPGGRHEADLFFRSLAHSYFAGAADPPSCHRLRRYCLSASLSGRALTDVRHVFATIRGHDLNPLVACGGPHDSEIAQAVHLARIRRADIVRWINQFGRRPTTLPHPDMDDPR